MEVGRIEIGNRRRNILIRRTHEKFSIIFVIIIWVFDFWAEICNRYFGKSSLADKTYRLKKESGISPENASLFLCQLLKKRLS